MQAAIKLIAIVNVFVFTIKAAVAMQREQTGVVMRVVDGDTLWLKINGNRQALKVRIQGIDAPEICQSGGVWVRRALTRRVVGQTLTVTSSARDDYGRSVGIVRMDRLDMGLWLVSQGHARVYSYRQKKSPYADELQQAQLAQRGVFSETLAEEPRPFRNRHGGCYLHP